MDELNTKRILITGSNGFLGQKLTDLLAGIDGHRLCCTSKGPNRNPNKSGYHFVQLDLLNRPEVESLLRDFQPTHIVHTAAVTGVEACQADPEYCKNLNVRAVSQLAQWCKQKDAHLTFLSTDFVFNGQQTAPYQESDPTSPCNLYGESKVEAEQAIRQSGCRSAILRTILVYGVIADKNRSNLVLWAKSKLQANQPIQVVSDQWRMPTWVDDLAKATWCAITRNAEGIYHISGSDRVSILEAVQTVAAHWKLDKELITPVQSAALGQATNRPRYTGFIIDKAKQDLDFQPTSFKTALSHIDEQIQLLWQTQPTAPQKS